MSTRNRIVVIGLGYVGLPLAVVLARHFETTGFDIDESRIDELRGGHDRTGEINSQDLVNSTLKLTDRPEDCAGADVYIVTVPTPVDSDHRPDLTALLSATRTVAAAIEPGRRPTIVFESTVYPGVTEELCGPEIERVSGLKRGRDFRLAYSPERINPGDRTHTIDKITKVIAGEDEEVVSELTRIYGAITEGGVFAAASIKAAEAAKAIENAQRDINIAFMNEVAQIFSRIEVSIWDVLAASRTKWNFLPFEPGLVGGHCIGIDPYYLSHLAQEVGHDPQVILAGRETNDGMGQWIADQLHQRRGKPGSVLMLGATFKEDVPDTRNSRALDVIERLEELGHEVRIADPLADPADLKRDYGRNLSDLAPADIVIGAVSHQEYKSLCAEDLSALVKPDGMVADIKGMWRKLALRQDIGRWTL